MKTNENKAVEKEIANEAGKSGRNAEIDLERYGEKITGGNVEPKGRDIAMVFQNYALYPHMTVYDNMGFAPKLNKNTK